ncbi:MAG TPA: NAD(P)H-quinone oxidoreductase [Pilimelia sp.]|nr:NAD(P)H-quinone oxidoreductase [Pilimelia sp.]
MYAITITEPGGPETLTWAEVPDPQPGPGEVLIEVAASAVNRADLLQRQGHYPPPPGAPPYPGLEASGTTADGTPVCALLSGGGYAQRVAVPAAQVLPVPAGVSLEDAAALPEAACTVWSNLVGFAGLAKGETLLVHGGGSGIGTFAIQLGVALGATVITTARAVKHPALRQLGAHVTVDYTTEDFVEVVRAHGGADVVLDIVGAAYLARNVAALARGGRLAVIGLQGGRRAELDLSALLAKRAWVGATALRSRPPREKAEIVRAVREQVWPLVEAGAARPVIDRRLPLHRAADAHRVLEAGDHLGKVLLVR